MAFLDEYGRRALKREMGALAAELAVDGEKRLALRYDLDKFMQKLPGRIAGLEAQTELEPLRQLGESARTLQACARRAALDSGAKLPACGRHTRIGMVADRLLLGGDRALNVAGMQLALAAFDDVQGLTMAEYWAFPEALRVAVCEACAQAAGQIISAAEEYVLAQKWVENGGREDGLHRRAPAFFERALQLAMELEKPDIRLRLENALSRMDTTPESCVRLAQESRALAAMRIGNLTAAVRALDETDWQKAFEAASRTETELRNDPSGAYSGMTRDSRTAVRQQVAALARRLGVGETTIARYAVNAAREAQKGDVRSCACWWLYDDEGRAQLAHRLGIARSLPRMHPDPRGVGFTILHTVLALAASALMALGCGSIWWIILLLPPVWSLVSYGLGQIITRSVRPRPVLKLEFEKLPDSARTLVAIPALLTSPERARRMCAQLETLGCLETDENLDFVLLGDFADAKTHTCDTDMAILSAARDGIARLNAAAGREKYFFLHRERRFVPADGIYRGEERKRGALMALCRVATGRRRGEFTAEGRAEQTIFGRYRYVVTLDADTAMLPGTAHALVGAIAHPLNAPCFRGMQRRGFAVMQPRVELDAEECTNGFIRLFAGAGGMNSYSGLTSDMYHDLTGTGAYCGKGVIDMPAFLDSLEGRLDGGRILSHDLIEGIIAGAGHINDVSLFDGFPQDIQRYLSRLARWTRGDWQLLPDIFRKDIPLLGRFRLTSNLVDSLREGALFMLFILGLWLGNSGIFALGVVLALIAPVISRLLGDRQAFMRGCMELATLPASAYYRTDAIIRALWRTFVSKRRLMEWVTSADARGEGAGVKIACRTAAILLLPGFLSVYWFGPALALTLLFLAAPGCMRELAEEPARRAQRLDEENRAALMQIARETWKFFERYVAEDGNYLPPDNVQLEPNPQVARRTSPTNIAMYMLSCVSARELKLIDASEMRERLSQTADTLERMEKWHGHVYNWVSIDTLDVLRPRYVSAVDSGNLAAALLLCAKACEGDPLAARLRALAQDMDFRTLYDPARELFHIGADVERGRLSASHYDLLASEARILSYTALMLGQIPIENWKRLGRPVSGETLMSWSGTMFEYLMPALIMRSAPGTLLGRSYEGAVKTQMNYAAARNRPWGVSESGYYVFDMQMNYQYRAFGMRQLSMGGAIAQDVTAPYASCLALAVRPADAAKNLRRMRDKGWSGECGMYEAVDFVRLEPRVVKSWMAHHQGMALCAICNALTGDALSGYFMAQPEARALRLLLNERAAARVKLRPMEDVPAHTNERALRPGMRAGRAGSMLADTALLGGAEATALVSARGDVAYMRRGVMAGRFTGDLMRRRDSMFTLLKSDNGDVLRLNSEKAKCRFGAGEAEFAAEFAGVNAVLRLCVSPEDGALVKQLRLANVTEKTVRLSAVDGFEVALMNVGELRSHPAFFRLFCRADLDCRNAVIYRRAPREKGAKHPALFHAAAGGACARETDWLRLMGRKGELNWDFAGRSGAQTDPCSALRVDMDIAPGETRELAFAVGLCEADQARRMAERYSNLMEAGRAGQLAASYVRSAAGFAGLDDEKRTLAERACAVLTDPRLLRRQGTGPSPDFPGAHADSPLICVTLDGEGALDVLRDAIRMHEYCRALGFQYQLAAVNDHCSDYNQPVRDGMDEMVNASHLRDMRFARGGVDLYDMTALTEKQYAALQRGACLTIDGRTGYWAQLRRALMSMQYAGGGALTPMTAPDAPDGVDGMKYGHMDGRDFVMRVNRDCLPPAPWSNIITAGSVGMLLTERGGGFIWNENSRLRRITNFDNDPASEGWGCMLYLSDRRGGFVRALPGERPMADYTVRHGLSESTFKCDTVNYSLETAVYGDMERDALCFSVSVINRSDRTQDVWVTAFVDWLMGADAGDAARTRAWSRDGALFAAGALNAVAYLACDGGRLETRCDRNAFLGYGGVMQPDGLMVHGDGGSALAAALTVAPGQSCSVTFALGCCEDIAAASAAARRLRDNVGDSRRRAREYWDELSGRFSVETGDQRADALLNGFLLKQVRDGRVRARAGFYQAGGAYGFRDQLQDMLALLPYEPDRVREHILRCAARQFEDGDVMHWWHPPMTGVRTRISDDMLFLPFVTAQYARHTGDYGILDCEAEFLENIEIPAGREDIYGPMHTSGRCAPLREHCMRAFRRACRTGSHGLLLMGSGDWNDGMNRVGAEGAGESVWLSMFFSVCAREFARLMPEGEDRSWLMERADEQQESIRTQGWDGRWYLRAYDDSGAPLGSRENGECRIDLIAQAWAALSGCDAGRVKLALDAAWQQLYLPDYGVLRLLTPAFCGKEFDPGYIGAYPPGVRENGGQYTHAACWYLAALAKTGNAERARELIQALVPLNHARTTEDADTYRVEPYVIAADVYGEEPYTGRGGWTWYTGAAGWLLCAVRMLIGYERRGDMVRLNALTGMWERPEVTLNFGDSRYTLISDKNVTGVTMDGFEVDGDFVRLKDDGETHVCLFPQRTGEREDIFHCI